jgi:hypothetical protein
MPSCSTSSRRNTQWTTVPSSSSAIRHLRCRSSSCLTSSPAVRVIVTTQRRSPLSLGPFKQGLLAVAREVAVAREPVVARELDFRRCLAIGTVSLAETYNLRGTHLAGSADNQRRQRLAMAPLASAVRLSPWLVPCLKVGRARAKIGLVHLAEACSLHVISSAHNAECRSLRHQHRQPKPGARAKIGLVHLAETCSLLVISCADNAECQRVRHQRRQPTPGLLQFPRRFLVIGVAQGVVNCSQRETFAAENVV